MRPPHHYGSRSWYETNWRLRQGLGENLTTAHSWYRGDLPAQVPNAEQVGASVCLTDGGRIENAIGNAGQQNGFLLACFAGQHPPNNPWALASSIERCQLQFFFATIIDWMYVNAQAAITQAFQMLLGPSVIVTWTQGTAIFPDVVVARMPNFAIICVDGTQNFQQLAMQAFAAVVGPTNIGIFGGSAAWYAASAWVKLAMDAAGCEPAKPFIFAAHSYGGAAALTLAARILAADRNRVVRALTFGCPKPGDARLASLLNHAVMMAMLNDTDWVGALPPTLNELTPVSLFLGWPELAAWANWARPPQTQLQGIDGGLTPNGNVVLDFPTLAGMAQKILLGQPFDQIIHHSMAAYRSRIFSRCPLPAWPISTALWNFLLGALVPAYWGDRYWGVDFYGDDYWL